MNNSIWRKLVAAALCVATAVSAYSATNETIKQLKKFYEAKARVSGMYVDAVSDSALIDYAISGMLQKLDPHSVYIPKSEMQQMNEPLVGEFEGIGVQFVMLKDTLYVDAVIPGGPAEKVGVLAGDRFIKANDTLIAGVKMTSRDIMKRLRGKKGTTATVTVVRRGVKDPFEFKITRDKIPLHSVQAAYMVSPSVGYIKLTIFSDNTKKEFDEALKTLKKAGMKDLIFDLQGNGGGYLKAASSIADEFLDGRQMIVYTKGRAVRETYKSSPGGSFVDGRIVFLVDESSASASEILSGAMQDNDRAVIVGRRTFAKGLVQMPVALADGSGLRITIARYYTPSGRCIQKPYADGVEKYKNDVIERYNHGELLSADSIHFPDSLKYETLNLHRTVYGGGGIMPDYFVPIDTTAQSLYLTKIVAKGVVNGYASDFLQKHEKELKKKYDNVDDFIKSYELGDNYLKELTDKAASEGVKYDEAGFKKSSPMIKKQLKAIFARRLFGTEGFYKTVNAFDDSYLKAMEILTTDGMYDKVLSKGAKK